MKFTKIKIATIALCASLLSNTYSQVGVGTTSPDGMLDLHNSKNYGLVFPRAALTASNLESPVMNPNGGALVEGTVVFNTSTTSTGANDVYPGIYAWDGNRWNPQYLREDSGLFEQYPLDYRTITGDTSYDSPTSDWADVPGLGAGSTFTSKYTGTYRIKANFNFGAGQVKLPSVGIISMATEEGLFRFTFDGSSELIYTHAYSVYNDDLPSPGTGTYFTDFKHDSSLVLYVTLIAGHTYNFQLEIDIFVASGFVDGGDMTSGGTLSVGQGHVGADIPCTVEFTYLEE